MKGDLSCTPGVPGVIGEVGEGKSPTAGWLLMRLGFVGLAAGGVAGPAAAAVGEASEEVTEGLAAAGLAAAA
jgi:hypothetical protein